VSKIAQFSWSDPFLLDEQLSEDERIIRNAAAAYAQEKLQPRAIAAYSQERTDRGNLSRDGRSWPAGADSTRKVWRCRDR
jgi:hypothetical protein